MTQEVYQEESAEVRRARLRELEHQERTDRAAKIAASQATTPPRNPNYDENGELILPTPKPRIVIPPPTTEELAAQQQQRYLFPTQNPQPAADHLADALVPDAARTGVTSVPKFVPKRSITLQPRPDKYPSSDPRCGLTLELIELHGMNVDPRKKPFEK